MAVLNRRETKGRYDPWFTPDSDFYVADSKSRTNEIQYILRTRELVNGQIAVKKQRTETRAVPTQVPIVSPFTIGPEHYTVVTETVTEKVN